ncbi:MAG: phosphatidylserine decarboxylase [Deltaproteobacteria bacterium]|nr:phosphatidylserine decarboxylase [Deltaproteobacteria bacterium]TLN04172.1 MAG: phosphatidylserine decarboxylase [bacterium]
MHNSHSYIQRESGQVLHEELLADAAIRFIYSTVREKAPWFFSALTGRSVTSLLGFVNYDLALNARFAGSARFLKKMGLNSEECLLPLAEMDTPRKIFERKIAYWCCRPMDEAAGVIVSPADSRMLAGSLDDVSTLFLKGKFFDFQELLGSSRHELHRHFERGDYAVFRLTPEKYHFTHAPVSGVVRDIYQVDGRYHSCNPSSVLALATPLSKNRRVVTVIDTDVEGGSRVGTVLMVEIVALMIGDIQQCYSDERYHDPVPVAPGLFLKKGQPKALFRPGSSTVVLIFEKDRLEFSRDLLGNQRRSDVGTRFSAWLEQPAVETELQVRSTIGRKIIHD